MHEEKKEFVKKMILRSTRADDSSSPSATVFKEKTTLFSEVKFDKSYCKMEFNTKILKKILIYTKT